MFLQKKTGENILLFIAHIAYLQSCTHHFVPGHVQFDAFLGTVDGRAPWAPAHRVGDGESAPIAYRHTQPFMGRPVRGLALCRAVVHPLTPPTAEK